MPHLQQVLDQVDCHNTIGATHTTQVVALHICAHAKVVDNHASDAGGGAENAACGHNDVHVLGL
jgi:hypothetical protein